MNTNLESIIPLLNKNLKIIQRSDYFNFSIDSLLISEFVNIQKNTKKILDLGTGNAAIPLFLSKKTSAKIYGIEIQEISYNLALRNININNLNEQIYIIYDNMKNYLKYFNMSFFDIIILSSIHTYVKSFMYFSLYTSNYKIFCTFIKLN